MSAPLIDRQQIATRHGLSYRYVRDTLTKRPDFPAPAQRLSQRLVRWIRVIRGTSQKFVEHRSHS